MTDLKHCPTPVKHLRHEWYSAPDLVALCDGSEFEVPTFDVAEIFPDAAVREPDPDEVVHYRIPGDASPLTLCGLDVWADDTSVTERAGSSNCPTCREAVDEPEVREPACPHGYEAEKWCDKCTPPSVLLDLVRQYGGETQRLGSAHHGGSAQVVEEYTSRAKATFDRIAALVPQQPVPARDRLTEVRADRDRIVAASDHLMGQLRAQLDEARAEIERLKAAQPDPSVLSLPQVPPGTVALIGRTTGKRWERDTDGNWRKPNDLPWSLASILADEDSVTVVMREPRTWPRLDGAPQDLKAFRGASGRVYRPKREGSEYFVAEDDFSPVPSGKRLSTWQELDGPLTEVFADEPGGEPR